MPMQKKPVRYAHADGHTDLCYSEDGKYIITCGNDGDIRVWLGLEDDDPSSQCVGEKAIAVAQKGTQLFVGTDNNAVQVYTFPDAERDGIVTRFTAPVTHIAVSSDGSVVAAGSGDMEIHVKNTKTQELAVLIGHKGPIFGVALDPKLKYLASSSGDGTVQVWDIVQKKSVHSWSSVPICNSFFLAKVLGRVSWEPRDGKHIAVPYGTEVSIWERDTWNKVHTFSDNDTEKEISVVVYSPNGKCLAACTISGSIFVWDVKKKELLGRETHSRNLGICALAWNPKKIGELAFCDVTGQLGTIEECVPIQSVPSPSEGLHVPENVTLQNGETTDTDFDSRPFFDDDDDDNENAISLEKIKAELALPLESNIDSTSIAGVEEDDARSSKVGVSVSELQLPFQPSSTPSHLQHHYMVWNSVGIVQCSNTPDDNVIDVEFHDISVHHALHIKNYLNHHIATLTEEALILACERSADTPSKLVCVLLNCWDGTREWTTELPEEEEAMCVASGKGWIALATDARVLRLWTTCGTQREMMALPGPVLCLAAHTDKLIMVCHLGPGIEGDQNLGFCIMSLTKGRASSWQPLPLTPRCTLQWAGFSDEGTPCIMDSNGSLRILTPRGYWLPACNTQSHVKGKSDHYFLLGVSEKYQNVRAVMCKGSHYPVTVPRPTVVELPLQIALCELSSDKGKLEEKFWRSSLACPSLVDLTEVELAIKESIIKLFALACRGDLQARAAEICSLMPNPQVLQLAMKYASKLGRSQLSDRILNMDFSTLEDDKPRFVWEVSDMEATNQGDNVYGSHQYYSDGDSQNEDSHTESQYEGSEEKENLLLVGRQPSFENKMCVKPPLLMATPTEKKRNPFKKSLPRVEPGRGLSNLVNAATLRTKVAPKPIDLLGRRQKSVSKKETESGKKQSNINKMMGNQKKSADTHADMEMDCDTPPTSSDIKDSTETPLENGHQEIKASTPQTFVQWYSEEKSSLQEEFPDLGPAELTKIAMKRYKEMRAKSSEKKETTPIQQSSNANCEKNVENDKHETAEDNCTVTETQDSSKTETDTQEDNSMSAEESKTETDIKERKPKVTEGNTKKRKASSEELKDKAKKPSTGSSKLTAFLFKKNT